MVESNILEFEVASKKIHRKPILLDSFDELSESVQNYFFKNSLDHQIYAIIYKSKHKEPIIIGSYAHFGECSNRNKEIV